MKKGSRQKFQAAVYKTAALRTSSARPSATKSLARSICHTPLGGLDGITWREVGEGWVGVTSTGNGRDRNRFFLRVIFASGIKTTPGCATFFSWRQEDISLGHLFFKIKVLKQRQRLA